VCLLQQRIWRKRLVLFLRRGRFIFHLSGLCRLQC
jgi:hypothetical protein